MSSQFPEIDAFADWLSSECPEGNAIRESFVLNVLDIEFPE
jgi:hypothetical protein